MEEENKIGKKVFISYLNDDNEVRSAYVSLLSITDSIVRFETKNNIITIPVSRLLKLKELGDKFE